MEVETKFLQQTFCSVRLYARNILHPNPPFLDTSPIDFNGNGQKNKMQSNKSMRSLLKKNKDIICSQGHSKSITIRIINICDMPWITPYTVIA